MAGVTRDEIGGSEYLAACHGLVAGLPPAVDLEEASALIDVLVEGAADGAFVSAHDCSDGGLAVALAEGARCGRRAGRSATPPISTGRPPGPTVSEAARWFGESHSRVVLTCRPGAGERITAHGRRHGVPVARIGTVNGPDSPCRMTGAGHAVAPAGHGAGAHLRGGDPRAA